MRLPILIIHICGGVVGLLSGVAAVSFRKGSPRHRIAGNIFFISMLTMGSTAALLGNVFGGALTLYLVTTGWLTGRRREGKTTIFDWGALLFGLAVGVPILIDGLRIVSGSIPPKPGVPVGTILFLGSVALLAAAGDVRMLVRGGVFGTRRVAAASLAHVLWAVHRHRFLPGAATSNGFPGRTKNYAPGRPATDLDDFLANPRSLKKCIQEKVGAKRWRCSPVAGLDFMAFRVRRKPIEMGGAGQRSEGFQS